ncbi:MAG: lysophospholipid acyltransferase family protein [Candidatus Rokubacteria bacterium]|nr:lysophospholipid acyltransferase family protein [Candidatus Rokubacteria bacterium]
MGRRRPTPRWVRWGQRAVAALAGAAGGLAGRLSPEVSQPIGAKLGELAYWALPGRRRVALMNLERALGSDLTARDRTALARANFRHLGVTGLECCRLFFGPPGAMLARVQIGGVEHIKAALAEGRGALYLGAHFGNWELLAAAHVLTGLPPLNVIIRPLDNPFLDRLVTRGRERGQLRLILKRAAVDGVRRALTRGECVGILLDQNAGRHGVFVPFFGQPASTSRSLAVLALKTGAPVVPAFIHRLPGGDHEVTLEPAVPLARTGQRERDVEVNTARFNEVIERQVRTHPEQWFWVHRRWKTRPD